MKKTTLTNLAAGLLLSGCIIVTEEETGASDGSGGDGGAQPSPTSGADPGGNTTSAEETGDAPPPQDPPDDPPELPTCAFERFRAIFGDDGRPTVKFDTFAPLDSDFLPVSPGLGCGGGQTIEGVFATADFGIGGLPIAFQSGGPIYNQPPLAVAAYATIVHRYGICEAPQPVADLPQGGFPWPVDPEVFGTDQLNLVPRWMWERFAEEYAAMVDRECFSLLTSIGCDSKGAYEQCDLRIRNPVEAAMTTTTWPLEALKDTIASYDPGFTLCDPIGTLECEPEDAADDSGSGSTTGAQSIDLGDIPSLVACPRRGSWCFVDPELVAWALEHPGALIDDGLVVELATAPKTKRRGLRIAKVQARSQTDRLLRALGLEVGDFVLSFQGVDLDSVENIDQAFAILQAGLPMRVDAEVVVDAGRVTTARAYVR
ncbi:MAG: hypothetical protein ACTSX8_04040 [Alphaproteobacteria bacterium]